MEMNTQTLHEIGKIAGSIMAILSLLSLIALKPVLAAHKRRQAERAAAKEFQCTVLRKLDSIGDDVGDLQCDRLNQAHDYHMRKGYCPTEKKTLLCDMYRSYHAKGRNHLSSHYERDIMGLPDKPKGEN